MTPKYKIGQTFYKVDNGKILKYIVSTITITKTTVMYGVECSTNKYDIASFYEDLFDKGNTLFARTAEFAVERFTHKVISNRRSMIEDAENTLKVHEESLSKYLEFHNNLVSEARKLDNPKKKI